MGSLVEEGQTLWAQIQREQANEHEPEENLAADDAALVEEFTTDEAQPVADPSPEVSQAEYVAALITIAADLTTENEKLRQIAATALEQAAEVTQSRAILGIEEPQLSLGEQFMAATATAIDGLRGEDTALLADVMALRSELRDLTQPRRRWWRR